MTEMDHEVESAVAAALSRDAAVMDLLGGPRIFGQAGAGRFPYLTLGRTTVVDWSRGAADGSEHVLTLHVWARGGGKAATFEIMDKVAGRLNDSALPLDDHDFVRLKLQFAQARQEPESPTYHGILRFSATRQALA